MSGFTGSPMGPGAQSRERRAVPRFSLIASVEIIESVADVHISGRISEISRKGCYVDILNPLPEGTAIQLRISRDLGTFTTKGKIIYIQQGMGMGVVFVEPSEEQLKILDAWLAELSR
jgi:hypothetical protein